MGVDRTGVKRVDNGFSYNDNPVNVKQFHTPYQLITTQTGQSNTITTKIYENQGPHNIKLVQFGLGIPEIGSPLNDAEVIIEVWLESNLSDIAEPPSIQEIIIRDTENLIENDSVLADTKLTQCTNGSVDTQGCLEMSLHYMYREAPMYNVVLAMSMDSARNSENNYFNDGINVAGESMNPPDTQMIPSKQKGVGLIEIIQTDRKNDLWVDEYGYQWTKNSSDTWLQITKPEFQRYQDEISNVMTRDNSNFTVLVDYEIDRAKKVFDGTLLQKELPGYFAYTYPDTIESKLGDPEMQNRMMIEENRAIEKLEKILD